MEEKIIQYLRGNITSNEEVVEILNWIEASEANQKKYNELKNLWVLTGMQAVEEKHSRNFFENQAPTKTIKFTYYALLKYAAVFILAFLAGALTLYFIGQKQINQLSEAYNEIQVPYGEKSTITLYDGTKVWLNSGTSLKYPVAFSSNQRNVFIEGEAYFEVAKDKKKPFVVHSGVMDVLVLGTKFNVYSYPEDDLLCTTLEEGSVNVSLPGTDKKFTLKPGEQFEYSKSKKSPQLFKVDTRLFTTWKENILRFENAPLFEILKKMERWYNVKFIIDEKINTSERYTTTIKTESLSEILKVLSLTSEMKYQINENIVKISRP